ncbi:hypothetical protein [Myceligenerans pegani]|uniref:Sulfotransferase family protein n=1 Tax=Myceligenerans pegani TaxID=2776917 RepID=A0ABR9MYB1_9MICO|nr:hypothetical protein [Myceligenerans sp. TRM 65318]MBE1876378.1 hypothetical protein [Myceligenerans sp. TRM 65318]MBE3018649.1 hypothetical protein [Myceligenerans sp. TRM 65318]
MPKSGSTAIQRAAQAARDDLLEHGVLYPGKGVNHIKAASWLTRTPLRHLPDPGPFPRWWNTVKEEIDAAGDKRVLLSHEAICWTGISGARRTVEGVGRPTHGLLVLRNLGQLAPSVWQQNIKSGRTHTYHQFLRKVFDSAEPAAMLSPGLHQDDGYDLPGRWAEVLGQENLTVVVLEKSHPDRLLDTLEEMLGVPAGLLTNVPVKGAGANRGLSTVEAALIVQLNRRLFKEWKTSRSDHRRLVFNGAVSRLVQARVPGPDEAKIGTPRWALEAAAEIGEQLAESVRASGARVIGDLAELSRIGTSVEEEPSVLPETIPSDIALEALSGLFASATGWDASHTTQRRQEPQDAAPAPPATVDTDRLLQDVPAKDLAAGLAQRVKRRLDPR